MQKSAIARRTILKHYPTIMRALRKLPIMSTVAQFSNIKGWLRILNKTRPEAKDFRKILTEFLGIERTPLLSNLSMRNELRRALYTKIGDKKWIRLHRPFVKQFYSTPDSTYARLLRNEGGLIADRYTGKKNIGKYEGGLFSVLGSKKSIPVSHSTYTNLAKIKRFFGMSNPEHKLPLSYIFTFAGKDPKKKALRLNLADLVEGKSFRSIVPERSILYGPDTVGLGQFEAVVPFSVFRAGMKSAIRGT